MRLLWTQRERGPGQLIHKTLPETYYLLKPETRMRPCQVPPKIKDDLQEYTKSNKIA
ncbi:Retinal Guanylyl Cyclase 2 [Manis pentadactyla]|nr:Retinal Guanylyl Cyclase 2 [Manis pentadactyla]